MQAWRGRFNLSRIFEETPPTVRWLIYLSSFGNISYGYLLIFIPGYLVTPDVGLTGTDVGLLVTIIGVTFVVLAMRYR